MVPHLDFELVIAGNYFTDKQKMTDKPLIQNFSFLASNFIFFRGHSSKDLNFLLKYELTIFQYYI